MMESLVENVSRFFKLTMAQFVGDTDKVIALKNEKRAKSAINGQISALERAIEEQSDKLEEAEARFNAIFAPPSPLLPAQQYIDALGAAKKRIDEEEDRLAELEYSLQFFVDLLEQFEVQE